MNLVLRFRFVAKIVLAGFLVLLLACYGFSPLGLAYADENLNSGQMEVSQEDELSGENEELNSFEALPSDKSEEEDAGEEVLSLSSQEAARESSENDTASQGDSGNTSAADTYFASTLSNEEIDEVVGVLDGSEQISLMGLSGSDAVTTYSGATMFETAVAEAQAAYPTGSTQVILVGPGIAWVDALSAAGLAGALNCPILFTENNALQSATKQALLDLGVNNVIVVGGTAAISDAVIGELAGMGISLEARLGGIDCYDTQMKIYEYGKTRNLWTADMAIVATASHYGDALSVSPVAFAKSSPIFLVQDGELTDAQRKALAEAYRVGNFSQIYIMGGTAAVSERAEGFLREVGSCERIWGATMYETSAAIARWAVTSQGFSWDFAAFTTGNAPYDALAGSVLQGKQASVMLLVGDEDSATIAAATENKNSINSIRFFGGESAISASLKTYIMSNISGGIMYEGAGIAYESMLDLEYQASLTVVPSLGYSRDDISYYLNPDTFGYEDDEFYQFAVLNEGYSGMVSADQLNAYIATYGAEGVLAGEGQSFIYAAQNIANGPNEVYLLAHAILESGWGTSTLARGTYYNGEGFWYYDWSVGEDVWCSYPGYTPGYYYNLYGIGAYDSNPVSGGFKMAISKGWNTVGSSIVGGGEWITSNSSRYLNNKYNQNTLYKMRWNYEQAASESTVWKQYATASHWSTGIANVMAGFYNYAKIEKGNTGLTFLLPIYQ